MNFKDITSIELAFANYKVPVDPVKIKEGLYALLPEDLASGAWNATVCQVAAWSINNADRTVPEWLPDFNDDDQEKWQPIYVGGAPDGSGSGFRFLVSYYGWSLADASGGARFALKGEAESDHMDEFFGQYCKGRHLILKEN